MEIDYTIRFEQPWRVGSGEAAGPFLDVRVRRDGCRLPFLPGTSLQGLVRDAVQRLCTRLGVATCDGTLTRDGDGPPGTLCGVTRPGWCPLCRLTGSPHREGAARFGAAEAILGGGDGKPLDDPEIRQQLAREAESVPGLLVRSHPHTSIDPRSGRAADERLFSLEEASDELRLAGRVELSPGLPRREVALLVGALRWIREVGGGRRRGLGACRIGIDRAELAPLFGSWEDAVQHLKGVAEGEVEGGAGSGPSVAAGFTSHGEEVTTTVLQIDAVVRGEVAVGGRPESGNLIAGLPHVPGSALRGAFAARWSGDREAEEFGRCFLDGGLRFGYLFPRDAERAALPAPLSLHTCKLRPGPPGLGHGLVDLLIEPGRQECPQPECTARLVQWGRSRYGSGTRAKPRPLLLSPHNRIEFRDQTVKEGSLFAYETLPGGTRLRGFLRAETSDRLRLLLAGSGVALDESFRLRVGRRKGALGWLECTFGAFSGEDSGVGLFPDAERLPERLRDGRDLRIDLVTPAIVLDDRLRFREALTPEVFGLSRSAFDAVYAEPVVLSGWNAAHRLPKPDQLAVAAGSSYLLRSVRDEELTALRASAARGIGIRRVEGFGAFVLRLAQVVEGG